jgi:hypothetical protein
VAIDPDYSQALWSLSHAIKPSDPDEAARLLARYGEVQKKRLIVDQAGTLANDARAASEAHDWPEAIRQLQQRDRSLRRLRREGGSAQESGPH